MKRSLREIAGPLRRNVGLNFFGDPMNTILTLIVVLMPAAYALKQFPAWMGQTKENSSVSINDLRKAPTAVVLDGRSLHLSAYPWRDFMPSNLNGSDGSPMMVGLKVVSADQKPFPSGLRIDRAWVLLGEQIWEVPDLRGRVKAHADEDSWIDCSDSPVCKTTARGGPKWGPGVFVDVIVRLTDREGKHHFLQAPSSILIEATSSRSLSPAVPPNKSMDASGGSEFRKMIGPAMRS